VRACVRACVYVFMYGVGYIFWMFTWFNILDVL